MSKLHFVTDEEASPEIKELFGPIEKRAGRVPNMMRAMANSPAALKVYLRMHGALAEGSLPAKLRELIAVVAADANHCEYCLSAHAAAAQRFHYTPAQLEHLRYGESDDPKFAAALRFVRLMIESRGTVSDEEFDRLGQAGWTDGEIAEIIACGAAQVYSNYFNRIVKTDLDFPKFEFAAPPRRLMAS